MIKEKRLQDTYEQPLVSVLLPAYNGERFITSALESALRQTYQTLEILVIDDGSTDDSAAKIKPYLSDPRVRYLKQPNGGVAAARNTGIRHAKGEFIAFLDQDDLWLPDKIALQVKYLLDHPGDGMVHANQNHINSLGEPISYEQWVTDAAGWCFKDLFVTNRIAVLTAMVRRSVFEKVGLLNESLTSADDYDLWLRIAWHYPIGHINRTLASYRFHESNVSLDSFYMTVRELDVIKNILKLFPDIPNKIGRKIVNTRLAELYFHLGNWSMWRAKDYSKARSYYMASFLAGPWGRKSLSLWLWCLLSNSQRRTLQWYWHKLKTFRGALA